MIDELENYTQLPVTINNSEILIIITKEREEEKIFQFIMGLNDAIFGTVRSNIIQEEPLPKLKAILTGIARKNTIGV